MEKKEENPSMITKSTKLNKSYVNLCEKTDEKIYCKVKTRSREAKLSKI